MRVINASISLSEQMRGTHTQVKSIREHLIRIKIQTSLSHHPVLDTASASRGLLLIDYRRFLLLRTINNGSMIMGSDDTLIQRVILHCLAGCILIS